MGYKYKITPSLRHVIRLHIHFFSQTTVSIVEAVILFPCFVPLLVSEIFIRDCILMGRCSRNFGGKYFIDIVDPAILLKRSLECHKFSFKNPSNTWYNVAKLPFINLRCY